MQTESQSESSGARQVLLIGFEDQDNLGLRYLMSSVNAAGHRVSILTYGSDPNPILQRIHQERPDVIGFSLIFQYMTPDFGRVIKVLRNNGVNAHITIGGHYSSFEPVEVLKHISGLDSIVRFDGELTLVNLLNRLATGTDWGDLPGIAFRDGGGEIIVTPLAKPIADLDTLPWPDRRSIDYEGHPMPTASILGSRGCPWDCSFCSIRPFYEEQGGSLRRLRKPSAVVAEMIHLYSNRGVSTFLFQDDDFLAGGRQAKQWAMEIADLIIAEGLNNKIAFKMSCRSDEIDETVIRHLMAGGLSHVYMGVESGDEQGLLNMNKRLKPQAHFRAGRILKHLGLSFDFGFMLVDPYTNFDSIRTNIDFLEAFIGDGWSVAPFCRMLPYAGTPIKRRLEQEQRLLGTPFEPDYRFLDPKLDMFYGWMVEAFYERNFTNQGLCHILRALLFEAHLRLPSRNRVTDTQRAYLHHLTAVCNRIACYTLRSAIDYIEATPLATLEHNRGYLDRLTAHEKNQEARLLRQVGEYCESVQRDFIPAPGFESSFAKSWTFKVGDREAAGIGAA